MSARLPVTLAVLAAGAALVAAATLLPQGVVGPIRATVFSTLADAGVGTDWGRLEQWANLALFVPVGAGLALLVGARRWPLALLAGVLVSAGVEWLQRSTPGRVPDPVDILWNGLGAAGGVVAGALVSEALSRRDAARSRAASRQPSVHRPVEH